MNHLTGFISRTLNEHSPLKHLNSKLFTVRWLDHSLIRFKAVKFDKLPQADWIFFTSPKCVQFFFQGLKDGSHSLPSNLRWGVMGPGTGRALQATGIEADFTGSGPPDQTAGEFQDYAKGRSVLFPRATTSKRSIQKALGDTVNVVDLIVYDNTVRTDIEFPPLDIAILTSPMNARGFTEQYDHPFPETVLAWGSSTQKQLIKLDKEESIQLREPSESAAARQLKTIYSQ